MTKEEGEEEEDPLAPLVEVEEEGEEGEEDGEEEEIGEDRLDHSAYYEPVPPNPTVQAQFFADGTLNTKPYAHNIDDER